MPTNCSAGSRENAGFEVVDKDLRRHAAEECKRTTMAIDPREQLHVGRHADEQRARSRHDRDEGVKLALDSADRDQPHLGPIDLQLLTGFDVETRFGHDCWARAIHPHVLFDHRTTAAVTTVLQLVEDAIRRPR